MSMIGKILAHYEITSQLGKGGMGEVYRAKDQKLGRDVAIKVLPEEFAKDADRIARFQREAKLLASLNHPNIAAIYGLEESGGTNFLVLELVEGNTLADQIKKGPIPVEESLKLALQIAEALEAAHEKGVIHRDLKPANIKITPDGKVKVLDFGLAKAFAGEQAELNLSNSPTLSDMATMQGVILGTAAYMSPEQARGKPVDKRADIWAFGCVLYEMLTGQVAFQGEDVTEILAAVVKGGANLDLLPTNIHPRVREAITRCLQKDPKKRYRDIADAKYEVEQALADSNGLLEQQLSIAERPLSWSFVLPRLAAGIVLTAVLVGVTVWRIKPPPPSEPRTVMRFDYELPEDQRLEDLALSNDGGQFVYSTPKGLYVRSMDGLDARIIVGTEGAQEPFFSPDRKWIGYFSGNDRKLKKIAINGGAAVALCDVSPLSGASWSADNTIVYGQLAGDIMRISANGGASESLIKAKSGVLYAPQILPDGKSVLYSACVGRTQCNTMVQSLVSGEAKQLFEGVAARYLPTGHLVYRLFNDDDLFAVPFNLERLEVTGAPVRIAENVETAACSDTGTFVYISAVASSASSNQRALLWVDRKGKEEAVKAPLDAYRDIRISPDGMRVALTIVKTGGNSDIWVWDMMRNTTTRLTFDKTHALLPLWTPDSRQISFSSHREESHGVYLKSADGTGKDERLPPVKGRNIFPASWTGSGKVLLAEIAPLGSASFDIGALSMGDGINQEWKLLMQEQYVEVQPRVSPEGRYMAYTSNESGRSQVYVRPFPDVDEGGRWQISTGGGDSPLWSREGGELFYRNGDAAMVVSVKTQPAFSIETPKLLFRGMYVPSNIKTNDPQSNTWDISPDGKRFLMMKESGSSESAARGPRRINIVLNWFEELKQRVPVK